MLNLSGHSKFYVELITEGENSIVRKSAPSDKLFLRLAKQMGKQSRSDLIYPKFKSPHINMILSDDRAFEMEYLPHPSPVQFLSGASSDERAWFFQEIGEYLDHMINKCEVRDFDVESFCYKINSVFTIIMFNHFSDYDLTSKIRATVKEFLRVVRGMGDELDYITTVHGDFTLSNLLVDPSARQVYWLDFIDGWDHSVMIDFAKLMQEISYGWSKRFLNEPIDTSGYDSAMGEMLKYLDEKFFPTDKDMKVFHVYSVLNDLRLLQYEKDPKWVDRILSTASAELRSMK